MLALIEVDESYKGFETVMEERVFRAAESRLACTKMGKAHGKAPLAPRDYFVHDHSSPGRGVSPS
jgi:hypothetical protein